MPRPTQSPPDDYYPVQPLTIAEAVNYTSTRVPPPRTLAKGYNDNFSSAAAAVPQPSPFLPQSCYYTLYRHPQPRRRPRSVPTHLSMPAEELPQAMPMRQLTRDMVIQMTPKQVKQYQGMKIYSDHLSSLNVDGWLDCERPIVDTDAIARDFGADCAVSLVELATGGRGHALNRQHVQRSETANHVHGQAYGIGDSGGDGDPGQGSNHPEQIRSENNRRIAMFFAQWQVYGRR